MLEKLEPKNVFENFLEISKIPRGSGNERAVSDFIADFAQKNGAKAVQDKWNNLLIKKPGAAGFEKKPPVILQAHLDMVCEKNAATKHDFTQDPIDVYEDGGFLKARGTTLGADNGIGVAMCMALLSGDFSHPPLEIILTTDEEAGMSGAENFDITQLDGRRMINLDSNDDTTFTMGCAAGSVVEFDIPVTHTEISDCTRCEISVGGLTGGHSGVDIHLGRGNALRILGFVLDAALSAGDVSLGEISGGMKVNAIPREASAVILFPHAEKEKISAVLDEISANIKKQFSSSDPGLEISRNFSASSGKNLGFSNSRAIVNALIVFPCGVLAESREISDFVTASSNIGRVEVIGETVKISAMARAADLFLTGQIEAQIIALAALCGAKYEFLQRTPAWPYNPESGLLKIARETYKSVFGSDAEIIAIHAGLECGLFSQKFAEKNELIDILSFGPNAYDYHTPGERVEIASVARVWKLLLEILKNM